MLASRTLPLVQVNNLDHIKHCNTELKPDATACTPRGLCKLEPYTDRTMGREDPSGLSKTLLGAGYEQKHTRNQAQVMIKLTPILVSMCPLMSPGHSTATSCSG